MSHDCYDCGRTIESNPRVVRGLAFCDGCWYARQTEGAESVYEAVSLGWSLTAIKVGVVVTVFVVAYTTL